MVLAGLVMSVNMRVLLVDMVSTAQDIVDVCTLQVVIISQDNVSVYLDSPDHSVIKVQCPSTTYCP